MATIRSQIIAKIVSALKGAGAPSGLTVERFSTGSIEPQALPHINVRPGHEESEPATSSTRSKATKRKLEVVFECRANTATAADAIDVALDPLVAWTTKAVLADPGFGGLAIDAFETSTEFDADEGTATYGIATIRILVEYATKTQDQEVKP